MKFTIGTYLQEVRSELGKVIWPSQKEFVGSTIVALFVIGLFTLFLSGVNYAFYTGVQKALQLLVYASG